jgi:hypothetical protein
MVSQALMLKSNSRCKVSSKSHDARFSPLLQLRNHPARYNGRFRWALTPTRLGPYEILSPLGAGGMGEVYRARNTPLDRDVVWRPSGEMLLDRRRHPRLRGRGARSRCHRRTWRSSGKFLWRHLTYLRRLNRPRDSPTRTQAAGSAITPAIPGSTTNSSPPGWTPPTAPTCRSSSAASS